MIFCKWICLTYWMTAFNPSPPHTTTDTMHTQYSLNYQVMYFDTDAGGVVHNLAYLRWVEECRTKMATALGMNYAEMAREGRHLVLVSHEVHYHSPAFLADHMVLNCCLETVEKSSIWVKTEVRRAENDKLCVSVRQRLALVQMPQGRPCRIPAEWAALAAPPDATD